MSKQSELMFAVMAATLLCMAPASAEDRPAATPLDQPSVAPALQTDQNLPELPAKSQEKAPPAEAQEKPGLKTAPKSTNSTIKMTDTKPAESNPADPVKKTEPDALPIGIPEIPADSVAPKAPVRSVIPENPAKPAGKPAPAAKQESKAEPVKELCPCAKAATPLAEGYKRAYDDIQLWIKEVDSQVAGADANVKKLEGQIQENESTITNLKLGEGKDGQAHIRELTSENKKLWSALKSARKERAALCQGFSRTAAQKVKEYSNDISGRLKEVQSQMK